MDWMIDALRRSASDAGFGLPIGKLVRRPTDEGPAWIWQAWLWQVRALSVGMARATSRAVSRCEDNSGGQSYFGVLCRHAQSWMSSSISMSAAVSPLIGRGHGGHALEVTRETRELIGHLMLMADRVDRGNFAMREHVVAVGLAAELSMCEIMRVADAESVRLMGGVPVDRSSYWRTDWLADATRPMGRVDPESADGIHLSRAASSTLDKFRSASISWLDAAAVTP